MSVTTKDMDKPADHDERMEVMRRVSRWELGDPAWADELIQAYLYPSAMTDYVDAEERVPA